MGIGLQLCKVCNLANLLKLKVSKQKSYERGNTSKGYCRVTHSPILLTTLNITYFRELGYVSFYDTYINLIVTKPSLF